jgi:hypothetical protein
MTSDRQTLTTYNPTWVAPRGPHVTTWLAVDANPHHIRLIVVTEGHILGSFEAATGPRQATRTIQFIRKTIPLDTNPKLVGRYYDRWPPQLHTALVQEFGPVTWINPTLLNATLVEVERWRRLFKTYRALFFAICAEEGANRELSPLFDQFDLLCAWKNAVLKDLTANFSL